jgi:hypothetical protein
MKLFNNAARRTLVPDPLNKPSYISSLAEPVRLPLPAFCVKDLLGPERRTHCAVEFLACIASLALLALAENKAVKDFGNASFSPDTVAILQSAMEAAVATLPDPVSSSNVQSIAQSILRSAQEGERDPIALQRLALLELQITPRS